MSIIAAGTTSGTALVSTGDTNGTLVIKTNGTTVAATFGTDQSLTLVGATAFAAGSAAAPSITTAGDTNTGIFFPAADTIGFSEGGAEAMRIDSSGSLLINGTTQPVNTYKQVITFSGGSGGVGGGLLFNDGDSGNVYPAVFFRKDGAERGNINVSTSGTAYNSVSDYRLKEAITPMTGALAKVALLKPCTVIMI